MGRQRFGDLARMAPAALVVGACLACASPQMPLPPELAQGAVVVKAGFARSNLKPLSLKGYVLQDLAFEGEWTRPIAVSVLEASMGFAWQPSGVQGAFSFRLEKADGEPATLSQAVCNWGQAEVSGGTKKVEFVIPKGTAMVCEFVQAPGEEPWRLVLATGLKSVFSMQFRSGGRLFRGETQYETASTNVIEPIGLRAQYMTGTLFLKGGRPVAAVERILPGRILTLPSATAGDQALFVAVGASIFLLDWEAHSYRR
jgi:hypothetical protein